MSNGVLELPAKGGAGIKATLTAKGWICDNPDALEYLTRLFPYPENETLTKTPDNPSPAYELMLQVQAATGARIIEIPRSNAPAGTVF